jgi:hypothetical protein
VLGGRLQSASAISNRPRSCLELKLKPETSPPFFSPCPPGHKNFHNQHYLQPPVVLPMGVGIVHHNIIPFMLLSAVHTTCVCSGAVKHDHNAGLCIILMCSWCVANFGFEKMCLAQAASG